MNNRSNLLLTGLKISAVATAMSSVSVYAYEQGKGATAVINAEEKIEKLIRLPAIVLKSEFKGDLIVLVIQYGSFGMEIHKMEMVVLLKPGLTIKDTLWAK
ncbi:Uncharacterised protein [Rodentibacter pneumotropicus]|uniref:Uncharacterized protein n=1 Tax=Rodentibacter pneumotropicus TaxID=758 RepID=A0A3S4Y4P8_9PAST|nr:Uncharacterised protein [Rodentibacter pneumotropicus]